jgi:hypothetical protein
MLGFFVMTVNKGKYSKTNICFEGGSLFLILSFKSIFMNLPLINLVIKSNL